MNSHQNEMSIAQLLEKMSASYLNALNLGLALTGSKQAAISYADGISTAGAKAKARALAIWATQKKV